MSTEVIETPLFAEVAGDHTEYMLALIADPPSPPSSEELLARFRKAS